MTNQPTGTTSRRKKVVVLGGGVGGVTAAFALTQPELQGAYDVTLYQMGWRLGGKGASGRNAAAGERIEEHGLHIWLGFYYNAFTQMKRCYDELARAPGAPLATFDAAFKPQDLGTLMDNQSGPWSRWDIPMPHTTDSLTGEDHPSVLGYVELLIEWMADAFVDGLWQDMRHGHLFRALGTAAQVFVLGNRTLLHDALHGLRLARSGHLQLTQAHHQSVGAARAMAATLAESFDSGLAHTPESRRLTQVLDIACAVVVGLFEEGVVNGHTPFAALDDRELRTFLTDHGCHRSSLASPLLRGYYDLAFGFERGITDAAHSNSGAGTAIHAILRVCFEYRGSFMWRMQAGMGDTIFAPYYEVLRRRGVTFKFFHRVEALEVEPDPAGQGQRIARIRLARQADVLAGDAAYDPLVDVGGLPCWPSVPRFDQLAQGQALQSGPDGQPYNLESRWSGWQDVGQVVLSADDFDHAVLAIPVGAHRIIAAQLMQASPRYKAMVENVQTVQTFGVQLWLDKDIETLGWKVPVLHGEPQRAVCDAYADPLNSLADNSHLLSIEQWRAPHLPATLLYFCGVLPDELPDGQYPPPDDTAFPRRQADQLKAMTTDWLERHTGPILPGACSAGPALDWSRLVDPQDRSGKARFDSQYWRANVDPSERYVLTLAGSTTYRLKAGDSQFNNLALAGDWVDTGFNVGCVEAATMGGLQAARAIIGHAHPVRGEQTRESLALAAQRAGGARAGLPPYRPVPSDLQLVPPYRFQQLEIRSFPLRADPVRLQELVDRLNIAPPEVCEFRAVGDLAFMQLAVYPYLQSMVKPAGWFTENELSFNILVACGKRVNGKFVADALAYYFPFIYVDNNWAIATGREVFGYPKIASSMRFGQPGDANLFSLSTLALRHDDPQQPAREVELVRIEETERLHGFQKLVAEIEGVVGEVSELMFGRAGLLGPHKTGALTSLFKTFAKAQIGIVSLKQFRDAADPAKACYQAVVSTQFKIDKWHKMGLLPGRYAAHIAPTDSMPIVEALGLMADSNGRVAVEQPFVMVYDCTVTTGTDLFVAH